MYKINRWTGNEGCSYTSVTLSNGKEVELYVSDSLRDDFLTDDQVYYELVSIGLVGG